MVAKTGRHGGRSLPGYIAKFHARFSKNHSGCGRPPCRPMLIVRTMMILHAIVTDRHGGRPLPGYITEFRIKKKDGLLAVLFFVGVVYLF